MDNAKDAILGGDELGISGIVCYQPLDGLMELKVVSFILLLFQVCDYKLCKFQLILEVMSFRVAV